MLHDLSSKQKGNLGHKITFSAMFHVRVREKVKRRAKSFLPRSMEFCWSKFVRPRTKVHRIDEGYAWVPKTWDFVEGPNEEFGKSKVSGFGSVHETS